MQVNAYLGAAREYYALALRSQLLGRGESYAQGLPDIPRHVIQWFLNPRYLSQWCPMV